MSISVQLSAAQEQARAAIAERPNIPAADLAAAAVRDLVATAGDGFVGAAERVRLTAAHEDRDRLAEEMGDG